MFCGSAPPANAQRVCVCTDPEFAGSGPFGTGLSGDVITSAEKTIFAWQLKQSDTNGVLTHIWSTCGPNVLENTMVRVYIDQEANASIAFNLGYYCGVGWGDPQAPWGTKWFGKGAEYGAYFNNVRIPFQKSVKVTAQYYGPGGSSGGFYMIVRGLPNYRFDIGGIPIPPTARMSLQVFNRTDVQPLEVVPVAQVPRGLNGVFFYHTLAFTAANLNSLEGCYHAFVPLDAHFPGTVLSTGTEDYFDSAWYFLGGEFHLPVSGFTHLNQKDGPGQNLTSFSAYRFHEMDPIYFDKKDGFLMTWRNGETLDAAGLKCRDQGTTKNIVGSPSVAHVIIYSVLYTWP